MPEKAPNGKEYQAEKGKSHSRKIYLLLLEEQNWTISSSQKRIFLKQDDAEYFQSMLKVKFGKHKWKNSNVKITFTEKMLSRTVNVIL